MDEGTLRVTWDESGSFGFIHLTKAELEVFIASAHNGKHVAPMLLNVVVIGASEVRREFTIETDGLGFKLGLRFEVSWMPSDENLKKLQEIEENMQHGGTYNIYA